MPVEFSCPNCGGRLKTPDGSEGKKARCPKCEAVVVVPAGSSAVSMGPISEGSESPVPPLPASPPNAGVPNFGPPPTDFSNPYAAPQASPQGLPGQVAAGSVEIGDMLNSAWAGFQRGPMVLVGAALLAIVINMVFSGLQGGLQAAAEAGGNDMAVGMGLGAVLVWLVSLVAQTWLQIGQCRLGLRAARGQSLELATLFSGGDKIMPIILVSIVIGLVVMLLIGIPVGIAIGASAALETPWSIAIAIPFVVVLACYLQATYWPFYWLIIEGKAGVIQSLTLAAQLTKGHRLTGFIMMLLSSGIMILGFLALCVGILVAIPFVSVLWAVFYLRLTGEPTASNQA